LEFPWKSQVAAKKDNEVGKMEDDQEGEVEEWVRTGYGWEYGEAKQQILEAVVVWNCVATLIDRESATLEVPNVAACESWKGMEGLDRDGGVAKKKVSK
jgi:hypothetical protein